MRFKHACFFPLALGIISLLIAVIAGGCWDRREINQLAFVASIAADLEGEQRLITGEIVHPIAGGDGGASGGSGGGKAFTQRQALLSSGRGETLLAAGRAWTLKLPRRAYIAHASAVLVGEEMARHGLREVLSHIDRNPEFRRTTLIVLTRGPARDILVKAQGELESSLGNEIQGIKKWVQLSGYGFIPDIHQVLRDLSGAAITTILPLVELSLESMPPKVGAGTARGEKEQAAAGTPAAQVEEPEIVRTLVLNGAGLFQQDKLVGWFDTDQTRGWAWVRNKVTRAILELPCGEDNSKVSVSVFSSKAKIIIVPQEDLLQAKVKLSVEGNLMEQQCSTDFTKKEAHEHLEAQMAARITAEINSALEQAQAIGTDVFGFASVLHRKHPQLWRQLEERWPEEFKQLPVTIEIEAKLRRTGLTGRPWQPQVR